MVVARRLTAVRTVIRVDVTSVSLDQAPSGFAKRVPSALAISVVYFVC